MDDSYIEDLYTEWLNENELYYPGYPAEWMGVTRDELDNWYYNIYRPQNYSSPIPVHIASNNHP